MNNDIFVMCISKLSSIQTKSTNMGTIDYIC